MKQAARANAAEMARRVDEVLERLLGGQRRFEIVRLSSKKWHVSERQCDDYIALANAEIKRIAGQQRDERFNEHLAIRRDIRKRAKKAKALRWELEAAKDEARLCDLYPSEKHDVRSTSEQTVTHIYLPDNGRATNPAPPTGTAGTIPGQSG